MSKIILAGGTGFLGKALSHYYSETGAKLIILTRGKSRVAGNIQHVNWDGTSLGVWKQELEAADVLINLNGKSVDCRYTEKNKALIYSTRLDATRVLGEAVLSCRKPPKLWINASSATIYRHSLDKEMDEYDGEPGAGFSVDVCQQWEGAFNSITIPHTRKVILRTAIVLGCGGALQTLKTLAKLGAGGTQGAGNQYVSWLHETDFVSMVDFIINHANMTGVFNLASPNPVSNKHFMESLRRALKLRIGIPIPAWLLKIGAIIIGTEPELVLKSRRVVPKKMIDAGYQFRFEQIDHALSDLLKDHPLVPSANTLRL